MSYHIQDSIGRATGDQGACDHNFPHKVMVRTVDPTPGSTVYEFHCEVCNAWWRTQKTAIDMRSLHNSKEAGR